MHRGLHLCLVTMACWVIQGCATGKPIPEQTVPIEILADNTVLPPMSTEAQTLDNIRPSENAAATQRFDPVTVNQPQRTGRLNNAQLNEVSGISSSYRYPGLLYTINDSGNNPTLFAISETGESVAQWRINSANNRDWEDLTRIELQGFSYLVIGDTGDNLRTHNAAVLYLVLEPDIPATSHTLTPAYTFSFTFDEGPRNIEAFGATGSTLYLLSKEPVSTSGRQPHRVFALDLSEATVNPDKLVARRVATMARRASNVESWLAATLANVDLSHPTALEFDSSSNTAYVLTYREVLRFRKQPQQSWAEALAKKGERIWAHRLPQAEALSVSPGRAIWFTSEGTHAPLWTIPLKPPS